MVEYFWRKEQIALVLAMDSSSLFGGAHLRLLVPLEHAAPEVIRPDLIACNATVVHLVEPLVGRLFHAIFVAILTLLFRQVEAVFYLLIEWSTQRLCRAEFSLRPQVVLWQIRLRLEQRIVFFLCH